MRKSDIFVFGFRGFPNVQGGIETHVEHLAPRLVELGFAVTACSRSPYVGTPRERTWKGVTLLRIWTVRQTYLETLMHSVACALVAAFRRPRLVHVHGIGPALVTPLLRLFGLQVVVTHHGEDYNREKWGRAARSVLVLGEYLGMKFANKRIAISRNICDLIQSKYGLTCELIPNGVEVPDLPTNDGRIRELGLRAGRYVLTIGRIVPEKRQLDLLRAFRRAGMADWKLVIVGQADHASSYAELLASEAAGHADVVMAGYRTGETLAQLYAHAGLFVLPSSHEGLPIVLLEALSYGIPTLASDIPSNREVISDPTRIFKVGDIEDLSTKMVEIVGVSVDQTAREAIRRNDASRYDWAKIARRTAAVYRELATGGQDSAPTYPTSAGTEISDSKLT
ncbi:glycosyltransferase family 4 protein [Methylobacterium sp. WSM2598]|uniref:glycosyltransferase family 4 protein n=1 Tax=Methylobacterium sp. WSM2598 TaxID=398261 RepID=UPI0003A08729|nr:glycosyltransferase family 4 protein [Methylobacterium sp. WSM2598]